MRDSPTVTIRGQHSDDWEHLYLLLNDKDILRDLITDLPYVPEDGFRDRVSGQASNTHTLIAETGQPSGRKRIIGVAWLRVQTRRLRHIGQLTLIIQPDYRGSDLEESLLHESLDLADNWLGLRRIEVIVYAENGPALAFYEPHGFEQEMVMRRYALREGAYADACLLARVRIRTDHPGDGAAVAKPSGKDGRLEITIRGCEVDDSDDITAIIASSGVVYNTSQLPYTSRDSVRERLENLPEGHHRIVAVVKDKVVGQLTLYPQAGRRAHVASLGMMVHADFQGRGVGSALMEAAVDLAENWLNISRIELKCYSDNTAALALYRKFGFEIEGTLRGYVFRAGHLADSYLMARIRDEEP
jgi:putative acetyltransferase